MEVAEISLRSRPGIAAMFMAILGLLLLPAPLPGQTDTTDAPSWNFAIRPYFYLSGVTGSVTAPPLTIPINSSFSELLDNVQPSFFTAVSAEKGAWGLYGDFQYIQLVGEGTGQAGTTLELQNIIAELDLTFRPPGTISLRFLTGLRAYEVDQTLTLPGQSPVLANTFVLDPVLGMMGGWGLGDHWQFEIRGDIGGFGIGSEFTTQLAFTFLYRVSSTVAIPLGYRVLGYQIKTGDVWMTTRMMGLVVGVDIRL
jgi:hypothetical protein